MQCASANTQRGSAQGISVAVRVKSALLQLEALEKEKGNRNARRNITWLAEQLGFARNTVSLAIHHSLFPDVRAKVLAFLKLK